jgi:uncharacterized protein YcbK (DUF882 family)
MKDEKKRREEKISELKRVHLRSPATLQRPSRQPAKEVDRQAHHRRHQALQPQIPLVAFKPLREFGKNILEVKGLTRGHRR